MRTFAKTFFLFLIFSCIPSFQIFSQYDITTEADISWKEGTIVIKASAEIPYSTKNITTERFRITESIDRNLTSYVTEALQTMYLDSLYTISDAFTSSRERLTEFDSLNLSKTRTSSSMSVNLDRVTNIYNYDIFGELVPLLIEHRNPSPVPLRLNYEPTANFSGIVIYTPSELPYYGESEEGPVQPALFPKIFDRQMELVASSEMAEPEYLEEWGFVLYTEDSEDGSYADAVFEERVGLYPYYTTAEAVFGNNHTDILIPEQAARKILHNKANHRLIREGRIVILMQKPSNPE